MPISFRRFAATILAAFITGAVAVMLLEVAESSGLISNLAESLSRLAVWSLLVALLLYSSRNLKQTARLAFRFCAMFLLLDLVWDVIEDIDYLNQLPLVGGQSRWRHVVEKATVSTWGCGLLYLMYVLTRDLDSSFTELRKQNADNLQLNRQLECTIGDLRNAQSQIVQQERLAALGQMASGVAHDLNNALTPVLTFSELLKEAPDSTEETLAAAEYIHSGAAHACQVVEQLQHFYRDNSAGSPKRIAQSVSVEEIVRQAKDLTRFQWLDEAVKRGVCFSVPINVGEGDVVVLGNPTELIQLVTNLLLNAIEAMEKGGTINISVIRQDGLIELTVSDQGHGMSADDRQRCFEPFFSKKQSGTGLGLSVCYGIVRSHGGTIRCDANASSGCDFTVLLPADVVQDENKRAKDEAVDFDGFRVLVIDDDDLVLMSMSALLNSMGATVDTASDAESGIVLAREQEYDLVITDLGMPGVTGREVVSKIKGFHSSQRIAVSSGWSRHSVCGEFRGRIEPDFYISKPVNASKLRKVLGEVACIKSV